MKLLISFALFSIQLWCWAPRTAHGQQCPEGAVDVLIVGAGMAGLSAVNHLQKTAPQLTYRLIESTDRVGGRIRTVNFEGVNVEVGAGWSYDDDDDGRHVIARLLKQFKISTARHNFLDYTVFSRDTLKNTVTRVATSVVKKTMKRFQKAASCLVEYVDEALYSAEPEDDPGYLAGLADNTDRLTCPAVWKATSALEKFIQWYNINYEFGSRDTSCYSLPGGVDSAAAVTGGYVNLPRSFAEQVFATKTLSDKIDFHTKVTMVDYEDKGDARYPVKTYVTNPRDGCDYYLSKYVVMTVSIGVLQQNKIAFNPPLLREPDQAPYDFSLYQRLYFKFDSPLDTYQQHFLVTFDANNFDERCHHWMNWNALSTNKENIWMCTLTTEAVKELAAENKEVGGPTISTTQIDSMLNGLRAVFPNAAKTTMATGKYKYFFPDLSNEESFGYGSFENWKVGANELDDFYPFFGGGLEDQYCEHNGCDSKGHWRLHFSGSASCWGYYGLVDGAYHSGERSINYILYDMGLIRDFDKAQSDTCDDISYLPAIYEQKMRMGNSIDSDEGNDEESAIHIFWKAMIALFG